MDSREGGWRRDNSDCSSGRKKHERIAQVWCFLLYQDPCRVYLEDEPGGATAEEVAQAVKLHGELMGLAGATAEPTPAEVNQLSFRLAGPLPLDLDFKQTLLTMRSEAERLRALISYFETILPSIKRSVMVRQKAGGNGHAL